MKCLSLKIVYDITYMLSLKYGMNESTYKIETDSQTYRIDLWLPREKEEGRGMDWGLGVGRCKLSYLEWRKTRSYV